MWFRKQLQTELFFFVALMFLLFFDPLHWYTSHLVGNLAIPCYRSFVCVHTEISPMFLLFMIIVIYSTFVSVIYDNLSQILVPTNHHICLRPSSLTFWTNIWPVLFVQLAHVGPSVENSIIWLTSIGPRISMKTLVNHSWINTPCSI